MVKTHTAAPDKVLPDKSVQIGHNSTDPKLLMYHLGLIEKAERAVREAQLAKKKANQRATNAGITLEDLDYARKLREMGPEKALQKLTKQIHYLRILQVPVGKQLQLFDSAIDAEAASEKALMAEAFQWGSYLGCADIPPDFEKYPQHTPLGQEHQRGWYEGQEYFNSLTQSNAAQAAKEAEAENNKAAEKARLAAEKKAEEEAKKQAKAEKKAAKESAAAEKKAAKAAKKAAAPPPRGRKKKDATDEEAAKAKLADALN